MEKVRKHAAIVFVAHAVTIIESARVLCEAFQQDYTKAHGL